MAFVTEHRWFYVKEFPENHQSWDLNALMFVWMERTLLCEGQMKSDEKSFFFNVWTCSVWTRGQNRGRADGPASLTSKKGRLLCNRVTNLQRRQSEKQWCWIEQRDRWTNRMKMRIRKKSLGVNLPSVSRCLSSPCPCLSSHSLWLTSIVNFFVRAAFLALMQLGWANL